MHLPLDSTPLRNYRLQGTIGIGNFAKVKLATHLPTIEFAKAGEITNVKIVTPHEVKGYEHYIVKHVLLDKNYQFIDEHLFDPNKDNAAISTFTLTNYSGTVYALSLCNKHDLWLNSAEA